MSFILRQISKRVGAPAIVREKPLAAPEPGRQRMQFNGTPVSDEAFDEINRTSRAARGLSSRRTRGPARAGNR